jgi:RNA polymerase sigma factor (sigma-70 family)
VPSVELQREREAMLKREVELLLSHLSVRQRQVVDCRFIQSLSTAQTSRRLGIAEGTVKATLSHALKRLARLPRPAVPLADRLADDRGSD